MAPYDMIGTTYNASRQPDSPIAARLLELLSLPAGFTVADIAQRCSMSFWRFGDSAADLIRGVVAWAADEGGLSDAPESGKTWLLLGLGWLAMAALRRLMGFSVAPQKSRRPMTFA